MPHADELRRCLADGDIAGIRRLWKTVAPHFPQHTNDRDALVSIHIARTQMTSMRFKLRAYSHRWLLDGGYPSALPDYLKSKAERIYPRVVEGVGIAVKSNIPEVASGVQRAMEDAVMDAYAEGRTDPFFVRARMMEARALMKRYFRDLLARG